MMCLELILFVNIERKKIADQLNIFVLKVNQDSFKYQVLSLLMKSLFELFLMMRKDVVHIIINHFTPYASLSDVQSLHYIQLMTHLLTGGHQ